MSGCKIRAENRDKLQIIKERPGYGEFDILPVFMFGRIGQIADKTPFTVGGVPRTAEHPGERAAV